MSFAEISRAIYSKKSVEGMEHSEVIWDSEVNYGFSHQINDRRLI